MVLLGFTALKLYINWLVPVNTLPNLRAASNWPIQLMIIEVWVVKLCRVGYGREDLFVLRFPPFLIESRE